MLFTGCLLGFARGVPWVATNTNGTTPTISSLTTICAYNGGASAWKQSDRATSAVTATSKLGGGPEGEIALPPVGKPCGPTGASGSPDPFLAHHPTSPPATL